MENVVDVSFGEWDWDDDAELGICVAVDNNTKKEFILILTYYYAEWNSYQNNFWTAGHVLSIIRKESLKPLTTIQINQDDVSQAKLEAAEHLLSFLGAPR